MARALLLATAAAARRLAAPLAGPDRASDPKENVMASKNPPSRAPDEAQVRELLYQALETELGGVKIYETALRCAQNDDLRKEWGEYLDQTRAHVQVLGKVFDQLGLDTKAQTDGRKVVGHIGRSLVTAMEMALAAGDRAAAQLVACECVQLAETKDHANWELIGHVAKHSSGKAADALREAYE